MLYKTLASDNNFEIITKCKTVQLDDVNIFHSR